MSRSARLLALLQMLRNHRFPVAAAKLAEHFEVSVCTIYRDIDSLRDQGADISSDAVTGYVLKEGFVLPPLMFSMEENADFHLQLELEHIAQLIFSVMTN